MLESSETCDGKMQPTERVYFYSNWKYTSKNIDWVSRRVFPSLFLFFNLFYWTYYMCQMSANKDNSKPIYCDAWKEKPGWIPRKRYGETIWWNHLVKRHVKSSGGTILLNNLMKPPDETILWNHLVQPFGRTIWWNHLVKPYFGETIFWWNHLVRSVLFRAWI